VLRIVTKDNNPEKDKMATVSIEGAHARLGDFKLSEINLSVASGEFFVILGPSGAGKTVMLDLIAGFVYPREGRILLDDVDVTYLSTERRHIGYMFQNYALFPNMSVYKNIGFGLAYSQLQNRAQRIEEIMELVGISSLRDRAPTTLSGGEQQRVALARSLIVEPQVLLLDEPLSALDARSRDVIREQLRDTIDQFGITVLFVTHDQMDARLLADRVGIMYDGKLVQTGSVHQVYDTPENEEVAAFVGMENLVEGTVVAQEGGIVTVVVGGATIEAVANYEKDVRVTLGIRPENVTLMLEPTASSARNALRGTVSQILNLGPLNKVVVDCGFPLASYITNLSIERLNLEKGIEVTASFKASGVNVMRKRLHNTM
jgi:molybdate/tungstate transport system ATP-binding protein